MRQPPERYPSHQPVTNQEEVSRMARIAELVQRPDSLHWAGKDAGSNPAASHSKYFLYDSMTPHF